jgi:hypothetical protein
MDYRSTSLVQINPRVKLENPCILTRFPVFLSSNYVIHGMELMGEERRKFKRRYLMYYSRVYDRKTGIVIGYMVDLTPEGAMVISEEPIEVGKTYRLRMDMPEELAEKANLDFEAESVWCKPDIDPHFYGTGFQIHSLSEPEISMIERMIQEYGFRDG